MVWRPSNYYFFRFYSAFNKYYLCSLLVIFLWPATLPVRAQEVVPALENGKVIERSLNGGETHTLQISLLAGQYVCLAVEQQGIDVELTIIDGRGEKLAEMDALNSTQGPEIISALTEQAGTYRIEISSPDKNVPAGSYQVKILVLHPATEQDHLWIAAQRLYLDGKRLVEKLTSESQEQAIKKFAEALRIWQVLEDRIMVAHTLYYLASSYRRIGQTQHALVYYSYALELVRSSKQPREEVTALISLAIVLSELGEPRKALEYYEQALLQWRFFKDAFGEAQTLINLGVVNSQLGKSQTALNNYDQALAVWQKLGNRFQEAETLTRIGMTNDKLGEWQKSLEYTNQAQALYRTIGNKRGEAEALNNIGFVYVRLGEEQKALNYYNQALLLWRALGNRREEANTLSNIGFAEGQQNHQPKALASYQLSLKLWRESGDRRGEARVLQKMGELQASANEAKAAFAFYDQALTLLHSSADILDEIDILLDIADLHLAQSDPLKAKDFLTQAWTILQTVSDPVKEARASYGFARVENVVGNLNRAQQYIEAALAKTEAMRIDVGSQQLRASYLASVHKFYELNLDILMSLHQKNPNQGYDALALQASERARARSLLELLTEARSNLREGVDKSLLEREEELKQQLTSKAQHQLLLTTQHASATHLKELKQEISNLEDAYNQIEADIRKSSPRYSALTQPQPLGLSAIQKQLDDETMLLEYSLGEERSWLWAVTKNSITSFQLPKRSEIEQAALHVQELLIARGETQRGETRRQRETRISQADLQFPIAAAALSQMILRPVASQLENHRLLVVAEGALQYIPFGALPNPVGSDRWTVAGNNSGANQGLTTEHRPPLIADHEIINLPSASTLTLLREEIATRKPAPKILAMFADPVFTREEARSRSRVIKTVDPAQELGKLREITHEAPTLVAGSLNIQRLPYTRREAEQILAFVAPDKSFKAMDFAANRTAAMNPQLSQYRFLHFATHGLIDSEHPGLSSLVLSLIDEAGNPQNGFLRANEIYHLKLPADLVVLSACQTGLGKEFKGEGLVGLTRSFMYAGATRIVVSLWSVNDQATADLMTRFYQKMLQQGVRPAAALRAAQVEMWKQKQWSAPYYWAAFTLQGEWQ